MTDEDRLVSYELIEAINAFPIQREIKHCDSSLSVTPFDFYAVYPKFETEMKLGLFSGVTELEDVFDTVFEWLAHP
jgi:hypothetical protein